MSLTPDEFRQIVNPLERPQELGTVVFLILKRGCIVRVKIFRMV